MLRTVLHEPKKSEICAPWMAVRSGFLASVLEFKILRRINANTVFFSKPEIQLSLFIKSFNYKKGSKQTLHGQKGSRGRVIETTVCRWSSTCVCSLMFFLYLGDYQKPTEMFWGQTKVFPIISNLFTVFCPCYHWWRSVTREKINNNLQKIARCLERYVALVLMNLKSSLSIVILLCSSKTVQHLFRTFDCLVF